MLHCCSDIFFNVNKRGVYKYSKWTIEMDHTRVEQSKFYSLHPCVFYVQYLFFHNVGDVVLLMDIENDFKIHIAIVAFLVMYKSQCTSLYNLRHSRKTKSDSFFSVPLIKRQIHAFSKVIQTNDE
eukprot:m.22382 g.22382  ORF g.22382 m.22382 type:complete len:125 (-) comp5450_c1_seq1:1749-2123(-)